MKNYFLPSGLSLGLTLFMSLSGCNTASPNAESVSNSSEPSDATEITETPSDSFTDSQTPDESSQSEPFPVAVGTYTSDELFAAGGGGCGMTLWEKGTNFRENGGLFFNGFSNTGDGEAFVMLDSELVPLTRTAASGEAFYGQQTSQTFEAKDGAVDVDVDVTLGEPGEIESVAISEGTVTIEAEGQTKELSVVGDAGC